MGSVVCSRCGRVRWEAAAPCPGCGAQSREITGPPAGLARFRRKRIPTIEVPGRAVGVGQDDTPTVSQRWVRVAAVLASVGLVVIVILFIIGLGSAGPEVLISSGTTMGVPQGASWEVGKGGGLHGAFSVINGSAEVCFANYDMFGYAVAHNLGFDQCPANATYSSGFVSSGSLSGSFGAGDIYEQTFVPLGWTEGSPRPSVTWTQAAEILP